MHEQKSNHRETSFGYGIATTIYALIVLMDKLPTFEAIGKSTKRNIDRIGSKITQAFKRTS